MKVANSRNITKKGGAINIATIFMRIPKWAFALLFLAITFGMVKCVEAQVADPGEDTVLRASALADRASSAYSVEFASPVPVGDASWIYLGASQSIRDGETDSKSLLAHAQTGLDLGGVIGLIFVDFEDDFLKASRTSQLGFSLERDLYKSDVWDVEAAVGLLGENEAADDEVLRTLGYTDDEIAAMKAATVEPRLLGRIGIQWHDISMVARFTPHLQDWNDIKGSFDISGSFDTQVENLSWSVGAGIDYDNQPLTDEIQPRFKTGLQYTF